MQSSNTNKYCWVPTQNINIGNWFLCLTSSNRNSNKQPHKHFTWEDKRQPNSKPPSSNKANRRRKKRNHWTHNDAILHCIKCNSFLTLLNSGGTWNTTKEPRNATKANKKHNCLQPYSVHGKPTCESFSQHRFVQKKLKKIQIAMSRTWGRRKFVNFASEMLNGQKTQARRQLATSNNPPNGDKEGTRAKSPDLGYSATHPDSARSTTPPWALHDATNRPSAPNSSE